MAEREIPAIDKEKSLQLAISQIEKEFGKGSIMRLGDSGGVVDVPTLSGKMSIRVPAGTQNGDVLRVRGKGAPSLRGGGRGDLHIRFLIETPVKLSKEQQKMLDDFTASLQESNLPLKKRFVERAGNFFKGE